MVPEMFASASLAAAAALVAATAIHRRALHAVLLAVVLGVLLSVGLLVHGRLIGWALLQPAWVRPLVEMLFGVGAASGFAMSTAMVAAPRLRSPAWVAGVVIPGSVWVAGTFLAMPWLLATSVLEWFLPLPATGWALYALAATGVPTSLFARREVVRIDLPGEDAPAPDAPLLRVRLERERVRRLPSAPVPGALRVFQITDPHLGPWRSERSLEALCRRAVAADPDLVLLTGDYFTVEGAGTPEALGRALAPLRALSGRVYACLGNHDHEHPGEVRRGLEEAGVRLLVDAAEVVSTRVGRVQIVGLDHRWGRRRPPRALVGVEARPVSEHARVLEGLSRIPGVPRIVLLHDPGAMRALPPGAADLVLSGHTHGGHVGLVSVGLDWTVIGALAGMPDHGAWSRGRDRLSVHRASGHYGFPLRLGVPIEESILEVVHPAFAGGRISEPLPSVSTRPPGPLPELIPA
jgi:predicted MPP superfamily phosphohydrolase